jgi:SAM-dependent methyltransferase
MVNALHPDSNDAFCPACGSPRPHHFFQQPRVPVHATQLLSTPAEAAAYPMGEMRLAFCSQCAFITNTAYDAVRLDYSGNHEESQSFSPHFRAFARELARRWIEQYELRGKTALEIGCGKGDFLATMLEEGIHHAIGVDPGARPERMTGPAAARVEWVLENFTPALGEREPDAIVCRHTLEHIHSVRAFLPGRYPGQHRQPPKDRRPLRVARRAPNTAGDRVLGHLLRALFLLHAGLPGPSLPGGRLRYHRSFARL